jgi:glycosidase
MMRFGDQLTPEEKKTLRNVMRIVQLRKKHSSLRYGDFQTLQADKNIYAYLRSDENERILIILNKSNLSPDAELKFPSCYNLKTAADLFSGRTKEIKAEILLVTVEPLSFKIYSLK